MATGFRLSVAIPIHNEESVVPELLQRLRGALDGQNVGLRSRQTLLGKRQRSGASSRWGAWTYWGLPLVPTLMLRKLWLLGTRERSKIITAGLDARTPSINMAMGWLARCEVIPQKLLGTSLMAVLHIEKD